VKTIGDKVVKL